jgi:hypothetical protein
MSGVRLGSADFRDRIPIPMSPHSNTKTPRKAKAELDPKLLARFAELTKDEPAVPADGSCAVCGKPRKPERSRKYAHGCAEIDPFCSVECARKFHGTSLPIIPHQGLKAGIPICGTQNGYRMGCRCDACRRSMRDAKRRWVATKKAQQQVAA